MTVDELLDRMAGLASVESEGTAGLSELDHALQCAAALSAAQPADRGLQIAGLVHDIGHDLGSEAEHGRLGAALVRELLGGRVARLVQAHVPAKRYLVTVDDTYRARLSAGSVHSLSLQGGDLGADELSAFAASPDRDDAVALRRADDGAKVPGRRVAGLETWAPVLRDWVANAGGESHP